MANKEHLAILRQGVDVWNEWREKHPDVAPDLSRSDLSEVDLSGVNLYEAELQEANLRSADLRAARI